MFRGDKVATVLKEYVVGEIGVSLKRQVNDFIVTSFTFDIS